MSKPKVFLASPLFNKEQHLLLDKVEGLLAKYGFDFYSARHHSGSASMTAEDRKDMAKWDPIFEANVTGLNECQVCLANIGYQQPEGTRLAILRKLLPHEHYFTPDPRVFLQCGSTIPADSQLHGNGPHLATFAELPDAGTVWEMGYMHAQNRLVIGFHPEAQPAHMNLMLTHGCDGIVTGYDNLETFLSIAGNELSMVYPPKLGTRRQYTHIGGPGLSDYADYFDWTACHGYEASSKEVI